jgi:iron(II)-dependent oxidoreductase
MVLIPAGEFMMGHDSEGDHSPVHKVYIDSFYMDKYEVTNAQFQKYCEETESNYPEYWGMEEFKSGPEFPNHPVVGISWSEANKYAEWAGKRLPTEAEWEYAAHGGLVDNNYPYGPEPDTSKARFTFEGKTEGSMPVGSYPPNGFGLHDMSGSVVEWVSDYYDGEYYNNSPEKNPAGPEDGKFKVIRGGGWHSGPYCNRVYFRNALRSNWRDIAVGFRCAKDAATE